MNADIKKNIVPFSLKDSPSLIEKAWSTSKISSECQKERKAGSGQTLTGLGSYWKGRKPLILTRACILASLMPATQDLEKDIEIFEMLMGFNDQAMFRRLATGKHGLISNSSYADQVFSAKRPEQIIEDDLLDGIWNEVNTHLGTCASTINQLVEQLGIMRYGNTARFADTFSGSGSIPFEAARLGCDVFASDLNPVACMLTWGAFNIVGASPERHAEMKKESETIIETIDEEICNLGFEHDSQGNRGKVYLYCLETRCPRTGYLVPMSPSWIVSKKNNVIARLIADKDNKKYKIEITSDFSEEEMQEALKGTVRQGRLHHPMLSDPLGVPIKEIRGDYKDHNGINKNKLRQWEMSDIRPAVNDIWQERLYAIQWMDAIDISKGKSYPDTWFAAPTEKDLEREEKIFDFINDNLAEWQRLGIIPDMKIESGYNTSQPIRERGWTYWHHLFNPRHLMINAITAKHSKLKGHSSLGFAKILDHSNKLTSWSPANDKANHLFSNQAINTMLNYPARGWTYCKGLMNTIDRVFEGDDFGINRASQYSLPANLNREKKSEINIYITDPPYADAVQYDEITEFFIAWLRKNPAKEFSEWTWDSRRNLAIKGSDHLFKKSMIDAYSKMTENLSDNGIQIVQFTHQDGKVWSDMAQIFWGAGLQVVNDWYVATEADSVIKGGGYVQGSHIIILKKRKHEKSGWSDEIVHDIREEVAFQVNEMIGLNQNMKNNGRSENIYNDVDLQMAGYAAALRVLTEYTEIDGLDMTREALRERNKGDKSLIDDLIVYAVQVANEQLVPDGMQKNIWDRLGNADRYFLKMMEMESRALVKLDDFQNFAKAFRIKDYAVMMHNVRPNTARLMDSFEMNRRELDSRSEFAESIVRGVLLGINQIRREVDADEVRKMMQAITTKYSEFRDVIISVTDFISEKNRFRNEAEASAARILAEVIRRERIG